MADGGSRQARDGGGETVAALENPPQWRGEERAGEEHVKQREGEDEGGKRYNDDVGDEEVRLEGVEGGERHGQGGEGGGNADNGGLPKGIV